MLKPRNKVLIVGGGGYVGRNLVEALIGLNKYELINYGRSGVDKKEVTNIKGKVQDYKKLCRTLDEVDTVIYLVTENKSKIWRDHWRANVEGLRKCLKAAVKNRVRRFIYLSTTMVFEKQEGVVDENNYQIRRKKTGNWYVDTKVAGLKEAKKYKDINLVTIYPSVIVNSNFTYKKPISVGEKIKYRLGLMTQGGVMSRGGELNRKMSYVFIEKVVEAIKTVLAAREVDKEYLAISNNTNPRDYYLMAKKIAPFFPICIPKRIFRRLIGEGQYGLLHEENHYSGRRFDNLLINRQNVQAVSRAEMRSGKRTAVTN